MNARLSARLARAASVHSKRSQRDVTEKAITARDIAIAAAAGDGIAIGIKYVYLRWIEAGIDRVDEQAGMGLVTQG